jgi:hypothetical protein
MTAAAWRVRAPEGDPWAFAGAKEGVTEGGEDDPVQALPQLEETSMNRIWLSMIGMVVYGGIGLMAPSALAFDSLLAEATVSFGAWDPKATNLGGVPLDRLVTDPAIGAGNAHVLIPQIATITAGGSVNFIISGGHVLAVYDRGTKLKDIGPEIEPHCAFPLPPAGITTPCSPVNNGGVPIAGGILSDADDRIYRGPFLNVAPPRRDGVEVVQFTKPGTYLVICARKDHFINPATQRFEMFGYVRVLPDHWW